MKDFFRPDACYICWSTLKQRVPRKQTRNNCVAHTLNKPIDDEMKQFYEDAGIIPPTKTT